MFTVEASAHIDAKPEQVFAFLTDQHNAPRWLPSMMEVGDIEGEGVGRTFTWVYKLAGLKIHGASKVIEMTPCSRYATQNIKGANSTWRYALTPEKAGTTLTITVVYEIPVPVIGKIAELILERQNQREIELAVENIRALVEHGG